MTDLILDLIAKGGPYAVIGYLLWDRERLLGAVNDALADGRNLRERRALDLQRATVEYQELVQATREVLRDLVEGLRGSGEGS